MIVFDLDETLLFNIGINIFSCIITLIIFYRVKKILLTPMTSDYSSRVKQQRYWFYWRI